MKIRRLEPHELDDVSICLKGPLPRTEEVMRSVEYLRAALEKGWRMYVMMDGEEPLAKAVIAPPSGSPYRVEGEGIYLVHCLAVRPERAGRGIGSMLMTRIEEDLFGEARGLAALCFSEDWMPYPFFRRLGYEYVGRDSLVSLLLKRFDRDAIATLYPSHPTLPLIEGKLRVEVNYDPACPFMVHNYRRMAETARSYGAVAAVSERFIDDWDKYARFGGPRIYLNNRGLPPGPLEEGYFRKRIEEYLAKLPRAN